ncbi:Unknown protein [Striga hermonthica]|uniref:Essential protein Yae1 N-terminal domain-containing protein n=1 Tax=Striga hermonthica TaxID=68872 RepID=A0A9N7NBD9_STRHE|nr:Unknown protein [Striga hermonthica]
MEAVNGTKSRRASPPSTTQRRACISAPSNRRQHHPCFEILSLFRSLLPPPAPKNREQNSSSSVGCLSPEVQTEQGVTSIICSGASGAIDEGTTWKGSWIHHPWIFIFLKKIQSHTCRLVSPSSHIRRSPPSTVRLSSDTITQSRLSHQPPSRLSSDTPRRLDVPPRRDDVRSTPIADLKDIINKSRGFSGVLCMDGGIEDIFASSLNLEETHFKEGYSEGHADGLIAGKEEGQQVGLKTGFEVGEELGFYRGCVDVWSSAVRIDPKFVSARIQRMIQQMDELLEKYPILEPENETVSDMMDSLRLKYRAICASLNVKLEYNGYPKASHAEFITHRYEISSKAEAHTTRKKGMKNPPLLAYQPEIQEAHGIGNTRHP